MNDVAIGAGAAPAAGTAAAGTPAASPAPARAEPARAAAPAAFGARIITGLGGVLLAVVIAQLNDHVTETAMADIRGALGVSRDGAIWLSALYQAAQVCAMMFAPWCSGTFSLRRFTIGAVAVFALLGAVMPFAPDVGTLYVLRLVQGLAGGCLPPMLMTVALRFLPPGIKLYGLAAYALTATFAPNLGTPLAALWSEYVGWRWLFWQIAPLAAISIAMIAWGLPQDPLRLERLRSFDWRGVLLGAPAIAMLVIAFEQGTRLGWGDSGLIRALFGGGGVLLVLFLVNEWYHPLPFFKIQLLSRRNLTHSLITLGGVLLVLVAVPGVPAAYLAEVHGYRPLQLVPLALCVALPQLVALPLVAALCNIPRVDCRWVLGIGLAMIGLSCLVGADLTSEWVRENFYAVQLLQIFAQPMAVIPLLMLATNGMTPMEGPFASSWFNTVKGFSVVVGTGVTEGLTTMRERYHLNVLADQSGNHPLAGDLTRQAWGAASGLDPQALLALLSAMTAVSGFGLSKLFLNDAGWSLDAIGRLGMAGGVVTVVLGCGGGAWLVRGLGQWRAFMVGVSLAGVGALLWGAQAGGWLPATMHLAWACTLLGSLATGITSVAIMTAGMSFAGHGDQAGTDVTAVQSTRDLGEMIASSMMLTLTANLGYGGGFLAGAVLAVVSCVVAARLRRRESALRAREGEAAA